MAELARRRATYQDLVSVPAPLIAELIDGELLTQPRPAALHAQACSALGGELYGPFQRGHGGPGGWLILFEPELHLNTNVIVPDLAGWQHEQMAMVPNTPAITTPPNWVCEVLSPSTQATDRVVKLPLYAREGVHHVWLINPSEHTLEVFQLDGTTYRLIAAWQGNAAVHAAPFESFALELRALWPG